MAFVDLWVIEDRLWRFGSRGKVTERFIVFFEQGVDQRDEPSCNMTKDLSFFILASQAIIQRDGTRQQSDQMGAARQPEP